jgi:hypothetical protein
MFVSKGRITAAAVTGPARLPLPASSTPASSDSKRHRVKLINFKVNFNLLKLKLKRDRTFNFD